MLVKRLEKRALWRVNEIKLMMKRLIEIIKHFGKIKQTFELSLRREGVLKCPEDDWVSYSFPCRHVKSSKVVW